MRGRLEHALIQHIDDRSIRPARSSCRERLAEEQRRAQIDRKVMLIKCEIERTDGVALEVTGVVDKKRERSKRLRCRRHQRHDLSVISKVATDKNRPPAVGFNFGDQLACRRIRGAGVDRYGIACPRQSQRNRTADAARAAGDKGYWVGSLRGCNHGPVIL